ncbi:MAG: hypothetical protein PHP46_05610 [Candidatus Omnitrophica bacterium]|nr:hypothetical protein [Candidatus Omnitrophota bacterium]
MVRYFVAFILIISVFAGPAYSNGNVKDLKLFEYWDSGAVRKCSVYDVNGYLKAKAYCRQDGTVEKLERYDRHGNKTEVAFYDEKGMLKSGIDGWAATKWYYEGYTLMAEIAYDEDGRPIERKYYTEGGKLMYRQYRDDDRFNPYESAAMAMMLGGRNVAYNDTSPRPADSAY